MTEMTGGCLCGQVRYSANTEPAFVGVCHCRNCQKQTGTAFSVLVGIPKAAMSSKGSLRRFMTRGIVARQLIETSVPSAVRPFSLTPP